MATRPPAEEASATAVSSRVLAQIYQLILVDPGLPASRTEAVPSEIQDLPIAPPAAGDDASPTDAPVARPRRQAA
jgi:hypothetical protein